MRRAISFIIEAWPSQAGVADIKGQTPLMLAASEGDAELVNLLAPVSDINAQDYLGKTALHAAVSGKAF